MNAWLQSIGSPGAGLAAVLALLLAGLGVGTLLGPALARLRHPADRALVSLVLGLDVLALLALFVGTWGDLRRAWPWIGLLVGLALVGAVQLARIIRGACARASRRRVMRATLAVALFIVPLGSALCFPFGWDELTYHVEVPRRWLELGRCEVFLDLPYSAYPSLVELLSLPAMKVGGITAPRALSVAAWALCAVGVFRATRRSAGPRAAWALAVALSFMPVTLMVEAEAYAEGFLLLHAIALFLVVRDRSGQAHALSIGALTGFAAAVKLTGALLGPAAALIVLMSSPRSGLKQRLGTLTLAALVSMLVIAAFLARAAATGNPVRPYAAHVFMPSDVAEVASTQHHEGMAHGYGRHGLAALAVPVELAWAGDRYSSRLGWQWHLLLGLGILSLRARAGRPPVAAAAFLVLAWMATTQQARFLLPAVFFLATAAALSLGALRPRARLVTTALLVLLTLGSVGKQRWLWCWSTWQAGLGIGAAPTAADFIYTATMDSHLLACDAVRRLTPPDARVMLLFDARGLYIPRAREIGTPLFQAVRFTPPESIAGEGQVLDVLRAGPFTHVLVGAPTRDPDRPAAAERRHAPLRQALASLEGGGRLSLLWEREGYRLLAIAPP